MDGLHENCYVLFLRHDPGHGERPEAAEQPMFVCHSYAQARRLQQELLHANHNSVIRYQGTVGGGD